MKNPLPPALMFVMLSMITPGRTFAQNSLIHNENETYSLCNPCNAQQVWLDDFETYPSGSFPPANWSFTGNSNIFVDNLISYSGSQSLSLNGTLGGCWEAIGCAAIPAPLSTLTGFILEFYLNVSSNHQQGCHPYTFYLGLNTACNWQTGQGAHFSTFDYSGNIFDRGGALIGSYAFDNWYKVKIRYERINPDSVNLSYWLNNVCMGNLISPVATYENSLVNISVGSGDGTVWIDSVRFLQCQAVAAPTVNFSATDTTLCPGTCTNFTNLSANATSYQWSFPGSGTPTSTDANPQNICYNTPGQYSVTLAASNGTGSDTLTNTNYITVYPYSPSQGIQQNGSTLTATNQQFLSYQWYLNGGIIAGATTYTYVAVQSGTYSVVCIDSSGCTVEAVFNVIGIDEIEFSKIAMLFPNPTTSGFTIQLVSPLTKAQLEIDNPLGERVYSGVFGDQLTVSCDQFPAGIYVVKVKSEKGNGVQRLIVN